MQFVWTDTIKTEKALRLKYPWAKLIAPFAGGFIASDLTDKGAIMDACVKGYGIELKAMAARKKAADKSWAAACKRMRVGHMKLDADYAVPNPIRVKKGKGK